MDEEMSIIAIPNIAWVMDIKYQQDFITMDFMTLREGAEVGINNVNEPVTSYWIFGVSIN